MDTETRGYRVFMQFGLLTEAELEKFTGKKPGALKVQGCSMPSQTGSRQQMYLITLDDLSCCEVHAMRRIEMFTSLALSQEEFLLEASKQLHKEHATNVFQFNYEGVLQKNPVGLRDATGYRQHVKSLEQLRGQEMEAMLEAEAVPSTEPIDVDDDQPATHKSRRLQAEPKKTRKKRKAAESPDADRRSDAASVAASAVASLAASGSQLAPVTKLELRSDGGRVYRVGARKGGSVGDSGMDPILEEVASAMKSVPNCFKKLTIPGLLRGDKCGNQINGVRARVAGVCFLSWGWRWRNAM